MAHISGRVVLDDRAAIDGLIASDPAASSHMQTTCPLP